jgi:transposase
MKLKKQEAAKLLNMSTRNVARLIDRYLQGGEAALEHKSAGKPSNNKKQIDAKEHVQKLLKNEYVGIGPTLVSEFLQDDHGFKVSPETMRTWMIEANVWKPKTGKPKARRSRPRRACFGELIQMDTSEHLWFGDDHPITQMIAMIDDATSTLHARFYTTDSVETNMDCF